MAGEHSKLRLAQGATGEDRGLRRLPMRGLRCVGTPAGVVGMVPWWGRWCQAIDFSVRGARVRRRLAWSPGVRGTVVLRSGGVVVRIGATCVWARREGAARHICGLAFDEPTVEQARLLAMLVDRHCAPPRLTRVA